MRPSGWAAFLALFAILCTIFSAVVTVADYVAHPDRLETNLRIATVAAIAAVALLLLTRHLRAHEAAAPGVPVDPNRTSLGMGLFVAGIGLLVIGLAAFRVIHATPALKPDDFLAIPAGLMFFFVGVLVALPPRLAGFRPLLWALLMTAFAVTFDWVAFGPGERHFTGGVSVGSAGAGFPVSDLVGRIAFGIPASFMTVLAVVLWVRVR